eukprot:1805446-Rhodomonas_salina.4
MSGTDIASGASLLRVCYAMSGTDLAYGATRRRKNTLRTSCGTSSWYERRYLPTRAPRHARAVQDGSLKAVDTQEGAEESPERMLNVCYLLCYLLCYILCYLLCYLLCRARY